MPDSSIITTNKPFFVPDFAREFRVTASVVLRISRLGKHVQQRFAHRYYNAIAAAAMMSAHGIIDNDIDSLQHSAMINAFDGAALVGDFIDIGKLKADDKLDLSRICIECRLNDDALCNFTLDNLRLIPDEIIAYVSRYFTLKMGDLIFCATLSTQQAVTPGDVLKATINGEPSLTIRVK